MINKPKRQTVACLSRSVKFKFTATPGRHSQDLKNKPLNPLSLKASENCVILNLANFELVNTGKVASSIL